MVDLTLLGQGQEALRLLDARQPLQAAAICRRILASFPKHIDTYVILGQALVQTSRPKEALDLFRRVLSADPESLGTHVQVAKIYEQSEQSQEAIWHWQRAFELMPGNDQVRGGLQRLSPRSGIATPNPFDLTRAALARAYLRGQLFKQAIRELSELIALDARRYDLRAAMVEALERGGLYDAAAIAAQSLLDELPYCLKANLVLGKIWLNTAKDEQARALLQRAQTLDPENRVAHTLFGARSPLPLRIPRLPFTESDVEPIELPYLVDDEEIVAESIIIDARAEPVGPGQAEDDTSASEGDAEAGVEWPMPTPSQQHSPPKAPESSAQDGTTPAAELSTDATERMSPVDIPSKMSLVDVQRQYLIEHSEDHPARLDLARHLRDMGLLDQALQQYQILVEESYEVLPAVVHDLEVLARLYPRTQRIDDVLASAREREKRIPPSYASN